MSETADSPEPGYRLRQNARASSHLTTSEDDDVDIPEWADGYEIGNRIGFEDPRDGHDGVFAEQIVGFSVIESGLPVVKTPDELSDLGRQSPFTRIPQSKHVPPEEVESDG